MAVEYARNILACNKMNPSMQGSALHSADASFEENVEWAEQMIKAVEARLFH
jgi:hypothetical protein